METRFGKTRIHRYAFGILLLLILQWNLACTSNRRNTGLGNTGGSQLPQQDPLGGLGGGGASTGGGGIDINVLTDPLAQDEEPEDTEAEAPTQNQNNCAATQYGGLGIEYPEGVNGANVMAATGCVQDQQALQMLLMQSLRSFEHMGECFQMAVAQVQGGIAFAGQNFNPTAGVQVQESDAAFDLRFLTAQLGLVRCYRDVHKRLTQRIPWVQQARQHQQLGDQQFYFILQQLMRQFDS